MARPKKPPGEKRDKRLTLYLTSKEEELLNNLAESKGLNKTKIIALAMQQYVQTLEEPPPALQKERVHEIMRVEQEPVNGYVCKKGHPFWLEYVWPSNPRDCPCCGTEEVYSTWAGYVKKGMKWS